MYTIDFESERIVKGSPRSPRAVGISIKHNDAPSTYHAWGHPTNNNSTWQQAFDQLKEVQLSNEQVLCHNTKFDLRLAREQFDINLFAKAEDTLFLAFLNNPHDTHLRLKWLADKYLDMPPEEQTELYEWIVANVPGATMANAGEWISESPGDLAGKYAKGDTDRTFGLYHFFMNKWGQDKGMMKAYRRELDLVVLIDEMESKGIRMSDTLPSELELWSKKMEDGDTYLHDLTGEKPGTKRFFQALRDAGHIDESKVQYTAKGNPRYGREFLETYITDNDKLLNTLKTRSKLQKCIGTYLKPWTESYHQHGGRFYPYFNQTRNPDDMGTRTGRLSSNFQQIPHVSGDVDIPNLRTMVMPDEGHVLIKRDFSSQEIRIAAHYAEGSVLQAYIDDHDLDIHTYVQDLIREKTGMDLPRRITKTLSFLKLYAGGPKALCGQIGCTYNDAISFFDAYDSAMPEFKKLAREVEMQVRQGTLLRTWGGRLYDVEPPSNGRQFFYKLLNVLIQGSAADQTKEAMVRYHTHPDRQGRLLLQVHDELIITCPPECVESEMKILKWAMNETHGWDCPMLSDSYMGDSFGTLEELNEAA